MTWTEFMDGQWGLSHLVLTIAAIAGGTALGYLIGDIDGALLGNVFMTGATMGGYFMREAAQHGYDVRTWSVDGILDALLPALFGVLNLALMGWLWAI